MDRTELKARVEEAREEMERTEARIRDKSERGEEPTELDLAHLKVTQDNYYHGVSLLQGHEVAVSNPHSVLAGLADAVQGGELDYDEVVEELASCIPTSMLLRAAVESADLEEYDPEGDIEAAVDELPATMQLDGR